MSWETHFKDLWRITLVTSHTRLLVHHRSNHVENSRIFLLERLEVARGTLNSNGQKFSDFEVYMYSRVTIGIELRHDGSFSILWLDDRRTKDRERGREKVTFTNIFEVGNSIKSPTSDCRFYVLSTMYLVLNSDLLFFFMFFIIQNGYKNKYRYFFLFFCCIDKLLKKKKMDKKRYSEEGKQIIFRLCQTSLDLCYWISIYLKKK